MVAIANKMMRWLIFGVVVALVPIGYSYLNLILKDKSPTLAGVIGDGGLLLIISAICAGALGEVIGSGADWAFFKIISSGGAIITLLLSSLLFASVFEGRLVSHFDEESIANASIWVFILGMFPCAACIALSEL
jgi:hypothetical protein